MRNISQGPERNQTLEVHKGSLPWADENRIVSVLKNNLALPRPATRVLEMTRKDAFFDLAWIRKYLEYPVQKGCGAQKGTAMTTHQSAYGSSQTTAHEYSQALVRKKAITKDFHQARCIRVTAAGERYLRETTVKS